MGNDYSSAVGGCCFYNWCAHIFGNSPPPLVTAVNDCFMGLPPAVVGKNIVSFIKPTGFSKKEIKVFGAFFAGLCLVSKCFRNTFLPACAAKLADIKKTYDIATKYSVPGFFNMNGERFKEYENFTDHQLRLTPHYLHVALREYRDGRATEDELKEILRLMPSSVHSRQLEAFSPHTPVLAAACSFEEVDVKAIELLLNHGANPNAFYLNGDGDYTRLCCDAPGSLLGNLRDEKRKKEILSLFKEKKEPETFLIDNRTDSLDYPIDVANAIALKPFLQRQRNLPIKGEFNCREYLKYLLPDELEYDLVKDTLLSDTTIAQEEWERISLNKRLPHLTLQAYIKNLIVNAGITFEGLLELDGDAQKEFIRYSDDVVRYKKLPLGIEALLALSSPERIRLLRMSVSVTTLSEKIGLTLEQALQTPPSRIRDLVYERKKAANLLKNMSLDQLLTIESECLLTALSVEKVINDLYGQGAIKTEELIAQKTPKALRNYLSSQRESAYWIESNILTAERLLSCFSLIPIVPGAIKAIGGTVQAVAGLAFSLFFLLKYSHDKEQESWQKVARAASHILHGCANVLKGTMEAIPTVGAVPLYVSMYQNGPSWGIGQSDKILGYARLLPIFHGDSIITSSTFTV